MQIKLYNNVTNETLIADKCEYLHSADKIVPLWIDGPITCVTVFLATIGTVFALRFLRNARLNKTMCAALYALCLVDFMLLMTNLLFVSIEATSILFLNTNYLYDKQVLVLALYGIRNSFVMSSAMLVVYITYIRFQVVTNPLKFATNYNRARKSLAANGKPLAHSENLKYSLSLPSESFFDFSSQTNSTTFATTFRRFFRPFAIPIILVIISFLLHSVSYFEFRLHRCFNIEVGRFTYGLQQSEFRTIAYVHYKAVFTSMTDTIGPMFIISSLSLFTEYRIHQTARDRKKLFECQKRSRDTLVTEELKDKASKALAVFIVVKFLILRTLPTIIDIYELSRDENIQRNEELMETITRLSDFLVFLSSATNTLAYFGKNRFEKCFRWLEIRIRKRILRTENHLEILNVVTEP